MYIDLLPLVHLFLQRIQKISKANPVKSCRSKSHPTAGIALVKIAATHSARRATPQSLGILALRPFWRHFFWLNEMESKQRLYELHVSSVRVNYQIPRKNNLIPFVAVHCYWGERVPDRSGIIPVCKGRSSRRGCRPTGFICHGSTKDRMPG